MTITDLWTGEVLGTFTGSYTGHNIPPNGVQMLKLQ